MGLDPAKLWGTKSCLIGPSSSDEKKMSANRQGVTTSCDRYHHLA